MEREEIQVKPNGNRIQTFYILSTIGTISDSMIFNHLNPNKDFEPKLIKKEMIIYKDEEYPSRRFVYNPPLDVFSTLTKEGNMQIWLGYFNEGII